jgi:hypothetical protein
MKIILLKDFLIKNSPLRISVMSTTIPVYLARVANPIIKEEAMREVNISKEPIKLQVLL